MEIKMMKGPSEQRDLMIKQLIEGIEAAKQLQKRILITPRRGDYDTNPQLTEDDEALNHSLLDKMLSSFDNTISIAKLMLHQQQLLPSHNFQFEGSPPDSSSPRSENSHHQHLSLSKRRKTMPQRITTVSAGPTKTGLEGPPDDGYSWRKYGQKDILGAKHPRGYYRCTHRHTQGCAATKQVQRLDVDPSTYEIIYRGKHTCSQGTLLSQAQIKTETSPQTLPSPQAQPQVAQLSDHEVYLDLSADGALRVEPTGDEGPAHIVRPFSFNSGPVESGPIDNFLLDCFPTFGSSATSESNPFQMSPYQFAGPCAGLNVQTPESDPNGSISGPNSLSNSPTGSDFAFPLDELSEIDLTDFEF